MTRYLPMFPLDSRHGLVARLVYLRAGGLLGKFLLGLFLARFLGFEAVGKYGLIAAAVVIAPAIIRRGLFWVVSREIVDKEPGHIVQAMGHYWLWVMAAYVVLLPITLLFGWYQDNTAFCALAFAVIVLEHFNIDLHFFLIYRHKALLANVLLFVQSASWIFLFMAAAWLAPDLRNINSVLMAWIIGGVLGLLFAIAILRQLPWSEFSLRPAWYRQNFAAARSFWVSDFANTTWMYLDRYLITFFLGLELAGVYVLFWQIANSVALTMSSIPQLYRPKLIAAHDGGHQGQFDVLYRKCIARTMLGSFALAALLGGLIPLALPIIRQPVALQYLPLFWLILAGTLARIGAELAAHGLYVTRQDLYLMWTYVLGLIIAATVGTFFLAYTNVFATAGAMAAVYVLLILVRRHRLLAR